MNVSVLQSLLEGGILTDPDILAFALLLEPWLLEWSFPFAIWAIVELIEIIGSLPNAHPSDLFSLPMVPIPLYFSPLIPPCEFVYCMTPFWKISGKPSPLKSIIVERVTLLPLASLYVKAMPVWLTSLVATISCVIATAPVPCRHVPETPVISSICSKGLVNITFCSVSLEAPASLAVRYNSARCPIHLSNELWSVPIGTNAIVKGSILASLLSGSLSSDSSIGLLYLPSEAL